MINKNIRKYKLNDDLEVDRLLVNGVRFADGTEIFSWHRHDFVTHDGYSVDGGLDYLRRVGHPPPGAEDISVYVDEDHEINREHLRWGTYGKNGDEPLQWKKLKDLDTDHIEKILETQRQVPEWKQDIFREELRYRNDV